jgi:hypothetical protein
MERVDGCEERGASAYFGKKRGGDFKGCIFLQVYDSSGCMYAFVFARVVGAYKECSY